MYKLSTFLLVIIFAMTQPSSLFAQDAPQVLVFSKTTGFRHNSIEAGIEAIKKLGQENGFLVDATEDAAEFNEPNLKQYHAVVFLNTTLDVLDNAQQNDFERFIQAGGGFVGIHAATDTEYDWAWYGKLVGAYFDNHPNPDNVQQGTFHIEDRDFAGMENLPQPWERTDEFYAFKQVNPDIKVLISIDESTYRGGTMGEDHPMAWYHEFDGGRSFYTNMGHTQETFSEPLFLEHLMGGLQFAIGAASLDYSLAKTMRIPEENRFSKVVLAEGLNEPLELTPLPDGRVLFVERPGAVNLYSPVTNDVREIAKIPVSTAYLNGSTAEDGLLGIAADPNFEENQWVYIYYSPVGDEPKNILTRYTMNGDELDTASEIVVLEVPVQRDECCHTGGSITFDADGNLYLSTGDNTNPHATGYAPIDERPDRGPWDAQKSSANTNDLRGKILRIHPEDDGTYTIPEGNLFAPGTPQTRPEIYTMGHRNPYRISVDKHTGYLYWGDVGPDASRDSTGQGPAGHDEIGQARGPGNYGWPHFIGNNKAYYDVNFETGTSGMPFDVARPINDSPLNTGLRELPPAQPAFIWYPAAQSPEFPILGSGGRSAMAGPVYYEEDFADAARPYPAYYDGKLFIYEFMRSWIMAVTMDENGDFKSVEPFMPGTSFSNPLDLEFGPDGDLFMLEYGQGWFQGNDDARLVRIEYNAGNRPPIAEATVDNKAGGLPLTATFNSMGTADLDGDPLTYSWAIMDGLGNELAQYEGESISHTFNTPGIFTARLEVTDPAGASSSAFATVTAGNNPPEISVKLNSGNQSFFLPGKPFGYTVSVEDKEDGSLSDGGIAEEQVAVTIQHQEGFEQVATEMGHRGADASAIQASGQRLIEGSDCRSCHGIDTESIGPMYIKIADRYEEEPEAKEILAQKILEGGSGTWGEVMMPPHPQFTPAEVDQMVAYILSLSNEQSEQPSLPVEGSYTPDESITEGSIIIRASYTDQGAEGLPGATSEQTLVLRNPQIPAEASTLEADVMRFTPPNMAGEIVIASKSGAYAGLEQIDLTGISEIRLTASAPSQGLPTAGGVVDIRLNAPDGDLVGTSDFIEPAPGFGNMTSLKASITPTEGVHDIYFVFRNDDAPGDQPIMILLMIEFAGE